MQVNKLLVTAVLAMAIGAAIVGLVGEMKGQPMTSPGVRVPFLHGLPTGAIAGQAELASLERANAWLNSPPLTPADLRGKVVLIDFWTYTCINWLRTLPYVRAWAEKYKDQGLVVIGVHAPEFPFEKNLDNVRRAVKDMKHRLSGRDRQRLCDLARVRNQYWPALYFVDAQGRVRHHHFGEGDYEQSEMIIQQLLTEAGATGIGQELVSVDARGRRSRRRLGQPEVSGELRRLRAYRALCVARWCGIGQEPRLRCPRTADAQSVGAGGGLDGEEGGRRC